MNEKLLMIGFSGMFAEVAKSFIREVFDPSAIEVAETVESIFRQKRGEPVGCIVCSLHCLGPAIEENLRKLSGRYPESSIACFSAFPVTDVITLRCKRGGCRYIAFNITTDVEMRRLRACIAAGASYYPESISGINESAERELLSQNISLPARQTEVLRYALKGESVKATALELGISDKTVSTHRKRYIQKLGICNPWELLARAAELNIVSPFEVFRSLGAGE